jgi:hypothetical protein
MTEVKSISVNDKLNTSEYRIKYSPTPMTAGKSSDHHSFFSRSDDDFDAAGFRDPDRAALACLRIEK